MVSVENSVDIRKVKLNNNDINEFNAKYIKVAECGNITEFIKMSKAPAPFPITKISADQFVINETGEIKEYQKHDYKSQNYESVRKTLARLRRIINANCTDETKIKFVTLTYAENMTDTERLYNDFKSFTKRFNRHLQKQGIKKPEYIAVCEPQGRGAWHMHILYIFEYKAPYIDNNNTLAPLWGHGFTSCKAVNQCYNIGAYFSAYLADMEISEYESLNGSCDHTDDIKECEVEDENGQKQNKRFVKGGRLKYYPTNMNIYRCSRGIVIPETEVITHKRYNEIKHDAGKQTFIHGCRIIAENQEIQSIIHEFYNKRG